MLSMWWRGLILGVSIAAPLGPIGLLCINRTLEGGRWKGVLSGLGAASADAFYGSLAAFGLAALFQQVSWVQNWTQLIGGAFILYLGVRFMLKRAAAAQEDQTRRSESWAKVYFTTFLLTMSNPITIFSFLGMFAGAGVNTPATAIWIVLGIFSGSMLWWLILAQLTHWLGTRLNAAILLWINRVAGLALVIFGGISVGKALVALLG
jgi:threonine/homoserine/homoserine lactone efflux protein